MIKLLTVKDISRLDEIGLMPDQLQQLTSFRDLKQGLFIVSGPKKSGATSTFYALLRNHDAFLNSINTLEKQPSAELPNITQVSFSPSDSGTSTYGKKLEEMIRMGPDIVGVANCEDPETAKQASLGAKDGKIIYVQIEADSVIQALAKWLKLVGEKFNINAEKTKALYRAGKVIYDKHGKPSDCEDCQGIGYVGRTGVFETIIMNDELRKVVRHAKSLPEIGNHFRRAKMLYIQEQALRKVIAGITAINEMIRVTSSSKQKSNAKAKS